MACWLSYSTCESTGIYHVTYESWAELQMQTAFLESSASRPATTPCAHTRSHEEVGSPPQLYEMALFRPVVASHFSQHHGQGGSFGYVADSAAILSLSEWISTVSASKLLLACARLSRMYRLLQNCIHLSYLWRCGQLQWLALSAAAGQLVSATCWLANWAALTVVEALCVELGLPLLFANSWTKVSEFHCFGLVVCNRNMAAPSVLMVTSPSGTRLSL